MYMKSVIGSMIVALVPLSVAVAQDVPDGYPAQYAQVIEAAKAEGKVLIYSNMSEFQWGAFRDLAQERYPWLTIETTDMNDEMWEKYYAESGSGVETADMMLTSSVNKWPEFVARGGVDGYVSQEQASLPEWSFPFDGVFTVSVDPVIMAYNRFLIPEDKVPQSRRETLELVKNTPELQGKVVIYDPKSNEQAKGVLFKTTQTISGEWDLLAEFAPYMRTERGAATIREKLISGEYAIALMTSGGGIPRFEEPEIKQVVGWLFARDGVPGAMRNVAVTKAASHPNAAKLVLDLMLSRDGQLALGERGQTPYRADISAEDAPYVSYNSVKDQVGEENIILVGPDAEFARKIDGFLAKWDEVVTSKSP